MHIDEPIGAGTLGRNVLRGPARILDNTVAPRPRVKKWKVIGGVTKSDMAQFLVNQFQGSQCAYAGIASIPQPDGVPDERCARFCRLAEVICAAFRNDHLGLERHLFIEMISDVMEKTPDVAGLCALISHRESCIQKRSVGQCAKEENCIQQVGFSGSVRARDARKRTKADIEVDKVLESGDAKPGEHYASDYIELPQ